MSPVLYAIVTNHGFGHAARSLAVLRELHRQSPQIRVLLNTSVPRWFVESMLGDAPVTYCGQPLDVGIRQRDFLTMDLPATLADLRQLYAQVDAGLLDQEARFVRREGVGLVFADIPPLASDLARRAGVPCWMLGNFGWDFIYRYYADELPGFADMADRAAASYARVAQMFRPPFSETTTLDAVFPRITGVGLTGATPRFSRAEVLRMLALPADNKDDANERPPLVLLSFGGLGLDGVPYAKLAEFDGRRRPARHFLTFDAAAPPLANLQIITDVRLRQIDLLPIVERLISKPGHGTFCEVARTRTNFVCLDRDNFPETPVLSDALRNHFTHRILGLPEFFNGDWGFVTEPLTPPAAGGSDDHGVDGNITIAAAISEYFAG